MCSHGAPQVRARADAATAHGAAVDDLVIAAEAEAVRAKRESVFERAAHGDMRAQLGRQRHLVSPPTNALSN
jgi:hypothetical protein